MNLDIIFLTGLTTGGLTCLAVQGGLLATTLMRQVTVPASSPQNTGTSGRPSGSPQQTTDGKVTTGIQMSGTLCPVVYFMVAKLLAHTLLGFLLGVLGSVIQFTPVMRAAMQLLAGLFMVATALNMFNVHPIFRYIVIQPPRSLARLVRNQSKSQEIFAPVVLGLMTVLIPCGTTQAMELLAVTSGSPILGALIMLVFVLGTSPTFLVLGFIATRMRGKFQPAFVTLAAFAILFLGIVSLDGGLNLLGSPLAPNHILASLMQPDSEETTSNAAQATSVDGAQELIIRAENYGYVPNRWKVTEGQPIRIRLITSQNYACTGTFVIPSLGIQIILPETGEEVIYLAPQPAGTLLFTCGMGMYNGAITIG